VAGAVKIKKVYMDNRFVDGKPDVSLDIHLDNGQIIIFTLDTGGDDPRFTDFASGDFVEQPRTDGTNIYCGNGAAIAIDEIIHSLRINKTRRKLIRKWQTTAVPILVTTVALIFTMLVYPLIANTVNRREQLTEPPVPLAAAAVSQNVSFPEIGRVTVPSGSAEAAQPFHNPAENDCNLYFEIIMDDTLVYVSRHVKPGDRVDLLLLAEPFEAGEYAARINTRAYAPGGNSVIAEMNADIVVIVE